MSSERVWSSSQGVLHSRLLHDFPYPPLLFLMQSRLNSITGPPAAPLSEVLRQLQLAWSDPLESFRNTSVHVHVSTPPVLAGNQFSISSSFGKCACLWHLCPLTQLHTLRQRSHFFLKPSFPLLKESLRVLSPQSCGLCRPPLLSVFLNYSIFLCNILAPFFSFLVLLFSFGVFISSAFTTFDYKATLLSHLRTTIDLNGFRCYSGTFCHSFLDRFDDDLLLFP